jgi:hypothetical protein
MMQSRLVQAALEAAAMARGEAVPGAIVHLVIAPTPASESQLNREPTSLDTPAQQAERAQG